MSNITETLGNTAFLTWFLQNKENSIINTPTNTVEQEKSGGIKQFKVSNIHTNHHIACFGTIM